VLFTLTGQRLLQAFDQPLGVGRDAQQMRCLLERLVVRALEQDRVTAAGSDLDRSAVVVDLFDQREQVLARLAGRHRHVAASFQVVRIMVPLDMGLDCSLIGTTTRPGSNEDVALSDADDKIVGA